jgi:oligopeptide/dipeptide ABC transporter ATP-binding protein
MGLLEIPPAEVASGSMHFDGKDLLTMEEDEWRQLRGSEMAMIFQEPMTSLNPVFRIGDQIAESVLHHMDVNKKEAAERAVSALARVGIAYPERRARQYPHELSGGMRQRVMIAMALACEPKLLIADEPTTALDVTIQAQILELIRETQEETGAALMLITHDLGVVAEMVDEVIVMYAGRVVEHGTAEEVLLDPKHPYSEGLLASIPSRVSRGKRLNIIKGAVPNPFNMPEGCNFAPRCPYRFEACDEHDPRLKPLGDRQVACWKHQDVPS